MQGSKQRQSTDDGVPLNGMQVLLELEYRNALPAPGELFPSGDSASESTAAGAVVCPKVHLRREVSRLDLRSTS